MNNRYAPIVLFVYNRLEHTKRTIEALQKNNNASKHELFVFSDGPKKGEEENIAQLRNYIKEIDGFRNVNIINSPVNKGLANSVIDGVTQIIEDFGKVIVLEDDLICIPSFLDYMDEALVLYENQKQVYSITGYSYLSEEEKKDVADTYFLPIMSSWSWATWKDRWNKFDKKAVGYARLHKDKQLRSKFNYYDSYDWASMLENQMKSSFVRLLTRSSKIDSWAIRWYWTLFKNNGLSLFPRDSLVVNIGMDGSGTHCGVNKKERTDFSNQIIDYGNCVFATNIQEDMFIRNKVVRSLKERSKK